MEAAEVSDFINASGSRKALKGFIVLLEVNDRPLKLFLIATPTIHSCRSSDLI